MADEVVLTENQKKAQKFFGKDVDATIEKTPEQIEADKKVEEERVAAEAKEKSGKEAQEGKQQEAAATPAPVELSDEQQLEIISKRVGRPIKSWDELKLSPTEEDKKKEEEKRDSEKLRFGLKQGLFNKKTYEAFISDSKDPKDLVYSRELAEAKKDDPAWDDEKEAEFKAEFETKFGLDLDESSSKYKRGKKQLTMIADNILKTDYAAIYSLDAEYSKHETEQTAISAQQHKVLQVAPIYKADVEKVVAEMNKITIDFAGEKFEVPVPKETIESLTADLMNTDFAAAQIGKGYKKEELETVARQYVIYKNFNELSHEAAKLYRAKHEKGVRGIPPEGGKLEKDVEVNENLTDKQKEALAFFRIPDQPVNAN